MTNNDGTTKITSDWLGREKEELWFAKTLADFEINDIAAPPATVLL
jgi:hypothetical protein